MATANPQVKKLLNYLISQANTGTPMFLRPSLFTSAKTSITLPANYTVEINGGVYTSTSAVTLQASSVGTASARAGKDVYIYACVPSSGTSPTFVLSMNATVPSGYSAETSRKIGGFHCLCANVGTGLTYKDSVDGSTVNHPLNGYVAGDILPCSRWDLWHRPRSDPEGMVYLGVNGMDVWVSIYLLSWNGTKLVSAYGGVTADGASTKKFHGELFSEAMQKQGGRLPYRREFVWAARGSNEQTNVQGSNDKTTTGGHVDTKSRRMISSIGCEDCCGFLWQWTEDTMGWGTGGLDDTYYSSVDPQSYGRTYGEFHRLLVGGYWNNGSGCGSRSTHGNGASSDVYADFGGRGASEPLNAHALSEPAYAI